MPAILPMDERVARLKTAEDCTTFASNARERGAHELANQARIKAVQLRAQARGATTDVEHECLEAVYAYEEILSAKKGRRQPASRTWQMINRHGIIAAVDRVVTKRQESTGFTELAKMGMKEFAFEAVILRHPEAFTGEALAKARERMAAGE